MKLIPVMILAVVQGIAEFLPVSSSGHLALLGYFLGSRAPDGGLVLEVVLHLGTLCSVVVFYRSDLAGLASGVLHGRRDSLRLLLLLFVASIPAGVCGLTRDSDVLVDQMLAWDNALFRRDLGPAPEAVRDDVRRAVLEFLDLL
jgi:undecaprenyl-diphosphatase